MHIHKIALAAIISLTAVVANANPNVITSGPLIGLSIELVEGGNVTGGTVNTDGTPEGASIPGVRTEPSLTTPGTPWLAAGNSFGTATLDLAGYDTSAVSFDWGTPGYTDVLTVYESNGASPTSFTASDAGFGSQVQSGPGGYVTVTADAGYTLTALSFANVNYAFEVSNFTAATAAVPEPANLALMLGGLGMFGFLARKRRI